VIATIDRRIRRFLGSIRLPFRGVGSSVNSNAPVQLADGDGMATEKIRAAELMQHYGFTSHPPAGFLYLCVPVGGKTAHGMMIATDHSSRLKGLAPGELALYTDEGDSIVMKRGHIVEINTQTLRINASTKVELNTPKVQMNAPLVAATGSLVIDEDITDRNAHADARTMHGMRTWAATHTHHENDVHGETNVPTQPV